MARFHGVIGFASETETAPDVWVGVIARRSYFGDLIRNVRRLQSEAQVNDNVTLSNEISIVADSYALQHFHEIRYAEFNGARWKVTNVELRHPRLVLTLGGISNAKTED